MLHDTSDDAATHHEDPNVDIDYDIHSLNVATSDERT